MYRTPAPDAAYLQMLGRAAYTWAYAEWTVLYAIRWATGEDLAAHVGRTGGVIVAKFEAIVRAAGVSEEVQRGASDLVVLSHRRNDLMHARPATVSGQQRLYRWDPRNARATPGPIEYAHLEDFVRALEAALDAVHEYVEALRA
jgi:hypothetical protein